MEAQGICTCCSLYLLFPVLFPRPEASRCSGIGLTTSPFDSLERTHPSILSFLQNNSLSAWALTAPLPLLLSPLQPLPWTEPPALPTLGLLAFTLASVCSRTFCGFPFRSGPAPAPFPVLSLCSGHHLAQDLCTGCFPVRNALPPDGWLL